MLTLAFAADGRALLSGSADGTALVWDVTELGPGGRLRARRAAANLDELWDDLLSGNASVARDAIWLLADRPGETVPLLARHLVEPPPAGPQQPATWIDDLESGRPGARERAVAALVHAGAAAERPLRDLLIFQLPPAVEQDVRQVLQSIARERQSGGLRRERTAEVLERIGTNEARQLLKKLGR